MDKDILGDIRLARNLKTMCYLLIARDVLLSFFVYRENYTTQPYGHLTINICVIVSALSFEGCVVAADHCTTDSSAVDFPLETRS